MGAALLGGCAALPRPDGVEALFADQRFLAPQATIGSQGLFDLGDDMRAFARTRVAASMAAHGAQAGLYRAIRDELAIDYAAATTGTAAETFAARSGNCLSLVILTAAFAKHFELPFQYQAVHADGAWSRVGGLAFYSSHVNLRLGPRWPELWVKRMPDLLMTVDFLDPTAAGRQYVRPIPEARIVAMYLNNRAAETLVDGDADEAYWWARAALLADPSFTSAYNTLGVVYRRHGDLREAERALQRARSREPANVHVLGNLVVVLEALGRTDEARLVRAQVATLEPHPPFHFLDEGLAAAARGDYEAARELLEQELERMPYDDELHFAIAMTELQLGQVRRARRHVSLALENSTTHDRRAIYAAKLNYLESLSRK